ncbi:hypothetical protein [Virgibacillus sediminis]|uniref:Uncharacterized protein n=1 Tax=Virgibacillus sediminis TaxID=202260 RepID=A0ABV7A3H8_9BACI
MKKYWTAMFMIGLVLFFVSRSLEDSKESSEEELLDKLLANA